MNLNLNYDDNPEFRHWRPYRSRFEEPDKMTKEERRKLAFAFLAGAKFGKSTIQGFQSDDDEAAQTLAAFEKFLTIMPLMVEEDEKTT